MSSSSARRALQENDMTRSRITGGIFAAAWVLAGLACTSAGESTAPEAAPDRHLLLLVERDRSGFRVEELHVVAAPFPATRAPRSLRWRADVTDASGRTLFSLPIPESGVRRGAFANADGTTESVHAKREVFTFALRLPLVPEAAHVHFWDTTPDEPGGALALEPTEAELGAVPYPADVR
jgi:hypothetical protein